MSDQLTASEDQARPVERSWPLREVVEVLVVVAVLAAVGALAGVVWEWVWTAPRGVVTQHEWVPMDAENLQAEFTATGWYVVIGSVAGLLTGAVVALLLDRVPLLTLAGVVVGSVLGAWLMLRVGAALGPPDPHRLAETAKDGAHLADQLKVSRWSPWIAFPGGALVGLALVFIGLSTRPRSQD